MGKIVVSNMKLENKSDSIVKASARVVYDDAIVINGVKVINGAKGLYVSMPRYKGADGNFYDTAHPKTGDLRIELNEKVLGVYNEMSKGQNIQQGMNQPNRVPEPKIPDFEPEL